MRQVTTSDELLRQSYERAVRARDRTTRRHCVAPEALLAVVRREGREDERLTTLDHAMACLACREELELLRAIERAGGARPRAIVEGIRWRRLVPVALAASVLLVFGLGKGRGMFGRDDPADIMRGAVPEVTTLAPARDAVVSRQGELSFVWHAVPGARGYTVELLASDGSVALARMTEDTMLVLPPSSPLAAGAYRWWVRARERDGVERRSALQRVIVE